MNRLMQISFIIVLVLVLVLSIFGMAAGAGAMAVTEPQAATAWSAGTNPASIGVAEITVRPYVGWNT